MDPVTILPWAALALQLALVVYTAGKMKGLFDALEQRVKSIDSKQERFDQFQQLSSTDRAGLNSRVKALEDDHLHGEKLREAIADNVQRTREELASFRGKTEEQHRSLNSTMESLGREVAGLNRQLANIAKESLGYRGPEDTRPRR